MADEVQETLGRSYGMPELDDADLDAGNVALFQSNNGSKRLERLTLFYMGVCDQPILHGGKKCPSI